MKKFYLWLLLAVLFVPSLQAKPKYTASVVPKNMTVKEKKERFFYLLVPAVERVHKQLMDRYLRVVRSMKEGTNQGEVKRLKKLYDIKSDEELLQALKPHPQSIVLAQAALESSWGTSRFFVEANNIFGVHSINPNEPRIAASKKNGNRTVWLTKFNSIQESVRAYYRTISISGAFKQFRVLRVHTDNPFVLVKALHMYSEIGHKYAKQLALVIRHNNLTKYDR